MHHHSATMDRQMMTMMRQSSSHYDLFVHKKQSLLCNSFCFVTPTINRYSFTLHSLKLTDTKMKFSSHAVRSLAIVMAAGGSTSSFPLATHHLAFASFTNVKRSPSQVGTFGVIRMPTSKSFSKRLATTQTSDDTSPSSFPTWSYENHCPSMEWNSLHNVTVTTTTNLQTTATANQLILLGVHNKTLTGMAKTLDDDLKGALTDLLKLKAFKGKAGMTTPTVRVLKENGVVRADIYVYVFIWNGTDMFAPLCFVDKNSQIHKF